MSWEHVTFGKSQSAYNMKKTNIAKGLLLDRGCINCLYCIKGSLEHRDWFCRHEERNTFLYDGGGMQETPEELSCEDYYPHVNDAHKRNDFWKYVERTHRKYISLMHEKYNGKLDPQKESENVTTG